MKKCPEGATCRLNSTFNMKTCPEGATLCQEQSNVAPSVQMHSPHFFRPVPDCSAGFQSGVRVRLVQNIKKHSLALCFWINKPLLKPNLTDINKKGNPLYKQHVSSFAVGPVIKVTNCQHSIEVFKHILFFVVEHIHCKLAGPQFCT
jgi:hypothetical protein